MSHTSIKKYIQPRQHSDIKVKHICCFCVLLNTKMDASKMAAISWSFYKEELSTPVRNSVSFTTVF